MRCTSTLYHHDHALCTCAVLQSPYHSRLPGDSPYTPAGQLQQHLDEDQYYEDADNSSSTPFASKDNLQSSCQYLEPVLQGQHELCMCHSPFARHHSASHAAARDTGSMLLAYNEVACRLPHQPANAAMTIKCSCHSVAVLRSTWLLQLSVQPVINCVRMTLQWQPHACHLSKSARDSFTRCQRLCVNPADSVVLPYLCPADLGVKQWQLHGGDTVALVNALYEVVQQQQSVLGSKEHLQVGNSRQAAYHVCEHSWQQYARAHMLAAGL